jgi:adenosine deaminase
VAAFGDTIDAHPFDLLYQLGFKVTVNTDNRLMSGVTLTGEFELLVDTFGYDLGDLLELTLNAVDAAFLPLEDREALATFVAESFDAAARQASA